ncbi:MAG TPA: mechanosensitive ion channel domain-containing protein [Solirubrobacteraceae bacterium]|nr:mechanosensitive ion channel domain-containing protein [Solirubrobacteraceae bacterium]
MPVPILADSFYHRHQHVIVAIITVVAAVLLAAAIDRWLARRGRRLAAVVAGGSLSATVDTRLRFLRRLVYVAIIVIGIVVALLQFSSFSRVATTFLTSGAIAAAVIGLAARATLANGIAGVMLAVTQPLRIGDQITVNDQTGIVEDVGLTYTWLRTGADARLAIPNEILSTTILRNDSIRSATVATEASVWLAADADETAALALLETLGEVDTARIAEVSAAGVRVALAGPPVAPADRARREAELRAAALRALRQAGVPRAGAG